MKIFQNGNIFIIHKNNEDIPKWECLSLEHDKYVKELVSDITEWYEGNENSMSFKIYMESKIKQKEAFMAVDYNGNCLSIIAFSYKNNNITFFGISNNSRYAKAKNSIKWKDGKGYIRIIQRLPAVQ